MTATTSGPAGFVPPAYPYDRLEGARALAQRHEGGVIDLSVGTPVDPPPAGVLEALAGAAREQGAAGGAPGSAAPSPNDDDGAARGYPPSIGTADLRRAVAAWTERRLGAAIAAEQIAACVGTKEFVASTPAYLHLRRPDRDTVLYPAVSYPTYEMGAVLAGLRPVPVAVDEQFRIDLSSIDASDAGRAVMLWLNTPGNPAGALDDLAAAAAWGIEHDVPVFSDECYAEFTWAGPPRTVLGHGTGTDGHGGVVAVHSLSKRSNMAGMRVGWYAGDAEVVHYLREVRKHAGLMVPGPVQRAAVAALADDAHVERQRALYRARLERAQEIFASIGAHAPLPEGGFYLWVRAPEGDEWGFAEHLADRGGVLVSPGSFYGPAGAGYVRVALVCPDESLDLLARRLGS